MRAACVREYTKTFFVQGVGIGTLILFVNVCVSGGVGEVLNFENACARAIVKFTLYLTVNCLCIYSTLWLVSFSCHCEAFRARPQMR